MTAESEEVAGPEVTGLKEFRQEPFHLLAMSPKRGQECGKVGVRRCSPGLSDFGDLLCSISSLIETLLDLPIQPQHGSPAGRVCINN